MPPNRYHLAQVNIGRILGPIDSEIMAGFVAQLDSINALADQTPGFVWRLQSESGNATSFLPYDDPSILINMSVWESVEALKSFVYQSAHVGVLRDRLKWFEKPSQQHMVMWWIPAGHIPTIQEAVARLEFRRAWGDGPMAFSFTKPYPQPDALDADPAPLPMNFDQRRFFCASTTPNGDCGVETKFLYRQQGARVWALYDGGRVRLGSLIAGGDARGRLEMRYQHADASGRICPGRCTANPELLPDGRLRLHEEWQRTSGDLAQGWTIMEELREELRAYNAPSR